MIFTKIYQRIPLLFEEGQKQEDTSTEDISKFLYLAVLCFSN